MALLKPVERPPHGRGSVNGGGGQPVRSAEVLALTGQIEDFRQELLARLGTIEKKLDSCHPGNCHSSVALPGALTPRSATQTTLEEVETLPDGARADASRSRPRAGWTDDERPRSTRGKASLLRSSAATLDSQLIRRTKVEWNRCSHGNEMTMTESLLSRLGWTGAANFVRSAVETPPGSGWHWVHGSKFTGVCSFMIVLHALFIGFSASSVLHADLQGQPHPAGLTLVETLFAAFFTVELVMRFVVERWLFFFGPEFKWNLFDSLLTLSSILDLIKLLVETGVLSNISISRVFRVLRFFRLARMARVIRHFSSLRFVLFAILDSMSSLFWCLVLIALTLYVFAILLLNVASEHFQQAGTSMEDKLSQDLRFWYGGLYTGMLSLFMAISGGADWGDPMRPLVEVHPLYGPIFVCFILVMHFGVLNVVIGTFVATATEIASKDREALVKYELRQCELYRGRIKTFFQEADLDKSGTLSWEEFKGHMNTKEVKAYFQTLDLDVTQAHMLFELLDIDGSNSVTIDEFLEGCMRLRGSARNIDVNMLLRMNRKQYEQLSRLAEFLDERCSRIEGRMNAIMRSAVVAHSKDVLA